MAFFRSDKSDVVAILESSNVSRSLELSDTKLNKKRRSSQCSFHDICLGVDRGRRHAEDSGLLGQTRGMIEILHDPKNN